MRESIDRKKLSVVPSWVNSVGRGGMSPQDSRSATYSRASCTQSSVESTALDERLHTPERNGGTVAMRWVGDDVQVLRGGPRGVTATVHGTRAHVTSVLGPILDADYPSADEARRAAARAARYWLGTANP
jgi:hypothetical protein